MRNKQIDKFSFEETYVDEVRGGRLTIEGIRELRDQYREESERQRRLGFSQISHAYLLESYKCSQAMQMLNQTGP